MDKIFPTPLPKKEGGTPLTDEELQARWRKIAEFYECNGFFPNVQDLMVLWSVSKQSVISSLHRLDRMDRVSLHISLSGVQLGMTPEQREAASNVF